MHSSSAPHTERSRKRRRYNVEEEENSRAVSHLPREVINPYSRSASQRRQLSLAGLDDTEEVPVLGLKNFPHQRFVQKIPGASAQSDEDAEIETEQQDHGADGQSQQKSSIRRSARDSQHQHKLDVLIRTIHELLDQGSVKRAARLFGAVLQLHAGGREIDIRRHNLWAIGAEIIMREGEMTDHDPSHLNALPDGRNNRVEITGRQGLTTNMPKLKAYMNALIQNYPHDPRFPRRVSAVDFKITLLGCEIFKCYIEYASNLAIMQGNCQRWHRELSSESAEIDDDSLGLTTEEGGQDSTNSRNAKEVIRMKTHRALTAIVEEMNSLRKDMPFSKNIYFLQLRAVVYFFIADLTMADDAKPHETDRATLTEEDEAENQVQEIKSMRNAFADSWFGYKENQPTTHTDER